MSVTIKTNNKPRDILYWHELTDAERREHDYLDTEDKQQDATFVRYRDWCYYLNDFMRINPGFPTEIISRWEGYHGETYFSGILVRYVEHCERVVMARYYS
jgi:hypothetical protein